MNLLGSIFAKEIARDNSDMADGMRHLFDSTSILHSHLFQEYEAQAPESIDTSVEDKMSDEEREWRKGLVVGVQVDAVKVDADFNLKMWAKGVISDIRDTDDQGKKLFEITFENDSLKYRRVLWWHSPDIDRYNSKTQDDEWRASLKPDDKVDAYDNTRIWYASTIQDKIYRKDNENLDGPDIPVYNVGFRTLDPNGNKEDNQHRRYFGWSESFDEFIPAYSPRLQRLGTFAKTFEDSHAQLGSQIYEDTLDDQMDLMMYAKRKVFAVTRKRCKSSLLVSFLNQLGEAGAFDLILERLN